MNAIHTFYYHANVVNFWQTASLIVCIVLGIVFLLWTAEEPFLAFIGAAFAAAALILTFTASFNHTEIRKGIEMRVQVNNQQVWIPAHRQSDGTYWPNTFTRRKIAHK